MLSIQQFDGFVLVIFHDLQVACKKRKDEMKKMMHVRHLITITNNNGTFNNDNTTNEFTTTDITNDNFFVIIEVQFYVFT